MILRLHRKVTHNGTPYMPGEYLEVKDEWLAREIESGGAGEIMRPLAERLASERERRAKWRHPFERRSRT